jgi:hypothetical protein
MNKQDEVVYLGRIISLLARHEFLTLGEIKNKTRAFIRKRHQTDSSLFNTLELFVTQGMLVRQVRKSRIYYALADIQQKPVVLPQRDLVEAGVETQSELFKQLVKQAKEYKPKDPPPTSVDGFK